jgi:hypothetical protein
MKMRKITFVLAAMLVAAGAFAQDSDSPAEAPRPVRSIRVLENPYDIASFYRSSQAQYAYPMYPGLYGASGAGSYAAGADSRYPIAGYYRQGGAASGGYGYSAFWTNGYRGHDGFVSAGRSGGFGYRRRIGQNGDLFLLAPTFLAPVGPLSGAFFDAR